MGEGMEVPSMGMVAGPVNPAMRPDTPLLRPNPATAAIENLRTLGVIGPLGCYQ
jgi:hypothetical protein